MVITHRTSMILAWACSFVWVCPCPADWKDDVGYTALEARLAGEVPTGAGLDVAQTEVPSASNYLPDSAEPEFADKTIVPMSGASGPSSHATAVGRYYYGSATSLAPGSGQVFSYEATHWLNSGFLQKLSPLAPLIESAYTQNHSWIGSLGSEVSDSDALRRIDLVIHRDGVVVAAGVNNSAGTNMPKLLSSAYNLLAVGRSSGDSSYGPTLVDGPGRVKPDIVVPLSATSWTTPAVASAARLLIGAANADSALDYLDRPGKALLTKALLMGGATKDEFADWRKGFETLSTDGTVPLDYRYGAGELNIDNSHRILTSGEQEAGTASDVGATGWDHDTVTAAQDRLYFVEVPAFSYVKTLSAMAVWHRHIATTTGNPLTLDPSLANIDLRLYEADGYTTGALVDQSVSSIDNVEHLYLHGLGAGRYALELSTDEDWDFALTWDLTLAPTSVYDLDGDGDVDGDDVDIFETCATGPGIGPPTGGCTQTDFDGDDDTDHSDFGLMQACYGGPDVLPPASCFELQEARTPLTSSHRPAPEPDAGVVPIPQIGKAIGKGG